MERFRITRTTKSAGEYWDCPVISLELRVFYRNCFGKFKTKYVEVYYKDLSDFSDMDIRNKTQILEHMKELWYEIRRKQKYRRILNRI